MTYLLEHWADILEAASLLVAAASIITGLTPSPKDDEILKKIVAALSFLKPKDADGTFKVPFKK